MIQIQFMNSHPDLIQSLSDCINSVAAERIYLSSVAPKTKEQNEAFVKKTILNKGIFLVAFDDEKREVVGWCDISKNQQEGMSHIGTLGMGVRKDSRGGGIGSSLLGSCLGFGFIESNISKVELQVFASNTKAIGLYKKFGFLIEGVRNKARYIDNKYDDLILMAKFL